MVELNSEIWVRYENITLFNLHDVKINHLRLNEHIFSQIEAEKN